MLIDKKTYWFCKAGSRKRFRLVFPKKTAAKTYQARTAARNFSISPLACCFDVCYRFKHPRVVRPASWQIGPAPIGVADAAAVHRIFPYNLISDALRMAAHASLLPICAFPIAS